MKAFKSYTCLKIQVDGQPDVGYKRLIKGFFFFFKASLEAKESC